MKYEIGTRIRKFRERQGLSQKEFAKLIGVSNITPEVRSFTKKNYWYPLPQHDVDALNNLQQNPYW